MRDRIRKLEAALRQQDHAPDDPAALAVSLIRAGVEAEHQPGTQEQRDDYLRREIVRLCGQAGRSRSCP